MWLAEPTESTEPIRLSAEKIREFIINTRVRIQQALYEIKKEELYGVLDAEVVE